MGASDTAGYDLAGSMLGCRVLLSGNVPTNLGGATNEPRIDHPISLRTRGTAQPTQQTRPDASRAGPPNCHQKCH